MKPINHIILCFVVASATNRALCLKKLGWLKDMNPEKEAMMKEKDWDTEASASTLSKIAASSLRST